MSNLDELRAELLINQVKSIQIKDNYETELKNKDKKIQRLEAEIARIKDVKYKVANVITTHPTPISQSCYYDGLVISGDTPLSKEDKMQYPLIKSFNWVYAPKLGVVTAINMDERSEPQEEGEDEEQKIKPELGQWYSFRVEDHRTEQEFRSFTKLSFDHLVVTDMSLTEQHRSVSVENEKLIISTILEFETSKLFEETAVYLEDEFLNKIHFPANLRKKLFDKLLPSDQLYGIKLKVNITLREKWRELFVHDQNWALFEVERLCWAVVNSRIIFFV